MADDANARVLRLSSGFTLPRGLIRVVPNPWQIKGNKIFGFKAKNLEDCPQASVIVISGT